MGHINSLKRLDPAINSVLVIPQQEKQSLLWNSWEWSKALLDYSCLVTVKMFILSYRRSVTKWNRNQMMHFRLLSRHNLKWCVWALWIFIWAKKGVKSKQRLSFQRITPLYLVCFFFKYLACKLNYSFGQVLEISK